MSEETVINISETERIDRIRLIRSARVGAVTFHRLMCRFGSASEALRALPDIARRAGGEPPRIYAADAARRERDLAAKAGACLVFHGEAAYPPLLAFTDDAPAFLTVRGNTGLLAKRAVAVVGARNASVNGQYLAEVMARDLGHAGLLVVSGLARGIDAAAHRGALATGTLAVLGGGIDIAYPRENRHLQDAIAEVGALVTEARPGEQPTARHFPRRNRIIAGMSRGVVVVEAAPRSGSLITARLAGEYGRDVFAVPGAAHDPRGRGTNQLLRDGAILAENADDILTAWPVRSVRRPAPSLEPTSESAPESGPESDRTSSRYDGRKTQTAATPCPPVTPTNGSAHHAIVAALGTTPSQLDDIVRATGVASDAAQMIFTELELAGRLERHPGGRVALRATG